MLVADANWEIDIMLHHSTTHCNILQHGALYCNTGVMDMLVADAGTDTMLQHSATQKIILHHNAPYYNTGVMDMLVEDANWDTDTILQRTAIHRNIMKHTTT